MERAATPEALKRLEGFFSEKILASMLEEPRHLQPYLDASDEDLRLDRLIRMRTPFTATVQGVRSRFEAVEHYNIGPGWMCRELDGDLPPGLYGSNQMSDVVFPD